MNLYFVMIKFITEFWHTIIRKYRSFVKNPKLIFIKILYFISPLLNDKIYLKLLFPLSVGYRLNLNNPTSFNEKMQWLKINYRKPEFTKMVDKWEAKMIITKKIGEEYVVKPYGVWESFDKINFDLLPNQFVLKPTHISGSIVICKDKNDFNKKKAKQILEKSLKQNLFYLSREWPYKNVKPQILAEEYLEMNDQTDLLDYKFYCFHGVPKMMYVANAKYGYERIISYFDMNFKKKNILKPYMIQECDVPKPVNFEKMIEIASLLSQNHPFIRIDFFEVNKKIKFGEYTFYHSDGLSPFYPIEWDYIFGSWINLNEIKINN